MQLGASTHAAPRKAITKSVLHYIPPNCLPPWAALSTRMTLNRTVLDSGRHWPMVTWSPAFRPIHAGEQWAGVIA